jgi:hypothetical protein
MLDSAKAQRLLARWLHIICGVPILGYIYTPPLQAQYFAHSIRYGFVPVMLLAGLWMWKGHLLRRLMPRSAPAAVARA